MIPQNEILEAAKEAGCNLITTPIEIVARYNDVRVTNMLERFAAIIERRTIERCAVVCNSKLIDQITFAEHSAIKKCAAAIRKLGEQ